MIKILIHTRSFSLSDLADSLQSSSAPRTPLFCWYHLQGWIQHSGAPGFGHHLLNYLWHINHKISIFLCWVIVCKEQCDILSENIYLKKKKESLYLACHQLIVRWLPAYHPSKGKSVQTVLSSSSSNTDWHSDQH